MKIFIETANQLQRRNTKPESKQAQAFAQQWLEHVYTLYGDHPEIINKMGNAYRTGTIPKELMPHNKATIDFVMSAIQIYSAKQRAILEQQRDPVY
jgi:hypothetical protein